MRPAGGWLVSLLLALIGGVQADRQCPQYAIDLSQRSTVESIRARGFEAQNHTVVTQDGYKLNMVHASNPLIEEPTKAPLLVVHGTTSDSKMFCTAPVHYDDSLARNYAHLNASALSEQEIHRLLADDPASQSLVWLALNFGHHVWLLDRRGTTPSLGHVDPGKQAYLPATGEDRVDRQTLQALFGDAATSVQFVDYQADGDELDWLAQTVNPEHWAYSADEQIKYDVNASVSYILDRSEFSQLIYVGHSVGSAIALAALSEQPALSDKLSRLVLWAPVLYRNITSTAEPGAQGQALRAFTGPDLPSDAVYALQLANGCQCATREQQIRTCPAKKGENDGPLGPVLLDPEVASTINSGSAWEKVQNNEMRLNGKLRKYNFGSDEANLARYGQKDPPTYDMGRVTSRSISLWYGATDWTASTDFIPPLLEELKVHVDVRIIGNDSYHFGHSSFLLDEKGKPILLTIPSLQFIHSA